MLTEFSCFVLVEILHVFVYYCCVQIVPQIDSNLLRDQVENEPPDENADC